jgi:hypothetical protein
MLTKYQSAALACLAILVNTGVREVRRENGTATIENPDAWTIPVLTTPGSTHCRIDTCSGSRMRCSFQYKTSSTSMEVEVIGGGVPARILIDRSIMLLFAGTCKSRIIQHNFSALSLRKASGATIRLRIEREIARETPLGVKAHAFMLDCWANGEI